MEKTFNYYDIADKSAFLGMREETSLAIKVLAGGGNLAVYGPPKSGVSSLLEHIYAKMASAGHNPEVTRIVLGSERTCLEIVATIRRKVSGIPDDVTGVEAVLESLCSGAPTPGGRRIITIENFNLLSSSEELLSVLDGMDAALSGYKGRSACSFIFAGNAINAMKWIFEEKKYFFRNVTVITPGGFPLQIVKDHIEHGFVSSGKVMEDKQIAQVCRILRGNLHYINHLLSICDHISRGYISSPITEEAMRALISLHKPRFEAWSADLTVYQVSLLRAVLEGHVSLSGAEVIRLYGMNSSANVKRVREALVKKEIISFDGGGKPYVIDPLYEYWLRKYFFANLASY